MNPTLLEDLSYPLLQKDPLGQCYPSFLVAQHFHQCQEALLSQMYLVLHLFQSFREDPFVPVDPLDQVILANQSNLCVPCFPWVLIFLILLEVPVIPEVQVCHSFQ